MRNIYCFNAISKYGTDRLTADYALTDDLAKAEGVLVRSAALHETEFGDSLLAIARAGAGVNNIPLDRCANEGIVVFNTPGANANGVKELVIAGLLLAARDVVGGIEWCKENKEECHIAETVEKAEKAFRLRDQGQKAGRDRSWGHWRRGCQHCGSPWHGGLRIRSIHIDQCSVGFIPGCQTYHFCGYHLSGM